jgi:pimeloyl-ACP methyl ester carboxylesterase
MPEPHPPTSPSDASVPQSPGARPSAPEPKSFVMGEEALAEAAAAALRPFTISTSEAALADLRQRILATRWPERELVSDQSQGVQLATMQKLADYWAREYDWRKCEARLNAHPNYLTEIDGLDIHFIHVRSKHADALPLIVTHGWPGSVVEQLKIIGPLTDPEAYGGQASDAFHVVIPSLPGYGWSGKPTELGWDGVRTAHAWIELMRRLGYTRFVAQGGDWGALVTEQIGVIAPPELLAIHTNMPSAVPPEIFQAIPGRKAPPGLTPDEQWAFERLDVFFNEGLGYAIEMSKRPQTLYGIEDSPIGLAAWFCDHDLKSYELKARVFDGAIEGLTRDDILDNITLAWLTKTGISSARLYWENKLPFFVPMGVRVPIAISAFPDELYQAPKSWVERAYPNLIHYNRLPKGGHFAAWEQPELLTQEVRAGFRSLRN